ncbi:hypothetical protein Q8W71_06900 [Methylobacterium sp. NEAU 140]|uniref:helix-turn-helix transcriptional regulator n=1 Tax=Methylobacterium sp. NEAU 140 TaxID=3064945 RepID=UPI00273701C1|nr:hypothetical protein [Methylobacterium sp. NEAU 140]MDP4022345.1 hypothetical protein [Methylobacterium sp. NEAU 140]
MPKSYMSRATLARELDMSESTVSDMVRRGILPRPLRFSAGCMRWRWADVDMALQSLGNSAHAIEDAERAEGVRRAIEASKQRAGRKSEPR